MLAQLLVGAIVTYPIFYVRGLNLSELMCCVAFAVIVGMCIPDSWHE